jgi:putative inorganic carbon (hco3(-)) transporter
VLSRQDAVAELAHEPQPFRLTHPETWDWGWGGLLIFSILLFFRPQGHIAALGRMHLSDLSAAVGLSAMVFLRVSNRQSISRLTPELVAMLALGAVILLTVPTSFWPGGSVAVFTGLFVKVLLIFLLMVNTVTSPKRIDRICWMIVLAFGYVSARAWFDYARGVNLVEGSRVAGALGGFFGNPNDLALNLVAFLPLAMMYVKRPGPFFWRALSAVIVVLMFGAIVFTKSRSGLMGTVAMVAVFAVTSRSLTPTTVIAAVISGMLLLPALPQSFWDRMESITDEEKDATGSRSERIELMKQAWTIFLANPLTGIGAGQFKNYGPPGEAKEWRVTHNTILQVAAEIGIFGLIAFGFLVWRGFSAAWQTSRATAWIQRKRMRRRTPAVEPEDGLDDNERRFLQTHGAAMVAAMTGWFVCALFASVAFNWTFYYLLGLAVTGRDVVRARKRAYAQAKALAMASREVAA